MPRVPKIPDYQRQYGLQSPNVPSARLQGMNVDTNAGMFGAGDAKGFADLGQGLQQASGRFAHIYRDYQHTKATEGFNKFQESLVPGLYGPEGIFNLKGESALDAPAKAQELLEKKAQEYGLTNDLGRSFFDDYVGRLRRNILPQAARHASQERNNWMAQTYESQASTSLDMAMHNYTDPKAYRLHIAQGLDAVNKASTLAGLPAEAVEKNRREYINKSYSGLAHMHIADGNYAAAEGIIKSGTISGLAASKLEDQIKTKKKADIQFAITMRHEAERQAAKKWEDDVTTALVNMDTAKATQLVENAPSGLKKEGYALIDIYAKGKMVVNDEAESWKWKQMAVNDPERFVKEWNPTEHLTSMDRQTREGFTNQWESLSKGGSEAKKMHDSMLGDSLILDQAHRIILDGADPKKAVQNKEKAKMLYSFDRQFQDQVDMKARDMKRKLSDTEKIQIRDNMLIEIQKTGGFLGFGKRTVFAYESFAEPDRPQGLPPAAQWDAANRGWRVGNKFLPFDKVKK